MPEPFMRVGGQRIDLSGLDTVLFPSNGITKETVITYYRTMARVMLRHVQDRPLRLHLFPQGIDAKPLVLTERPAHFPDWVCDPSKAGAGGSGRILARSPADLIYLANQGTVRIDMGPARIDRIDYPDRLVFDLAPAGDESETMPQAARRLRRFLSGIGLKAFIQITGTGGVQVTVPIRRVAPFADIGRIAERIAERFARDNPGLVTTQAGDRGGTARVLVDHTRNAAEGWFVTPYSLRARPGAPVVTPLDWSELGAHTMQPDKYRIDNVLRRLAQKPDPWHGMTRHAASPYKAVERLAKI